ncbi:SUKH-4 family immunity protein [Streptomyces cavernicola]|uniref:SUKH-4 family immunity protein n=1 Tax=Streptomyces cavernicola TaxID=3043613 RepID=A0ABT6SG54_9ACTN|nr:SUKH-4 family immunity protein [Streptomyces sp. B-S-A6]MDI3407181.1 SUKH-4 family immunity protein [Streptomyces sp. B-S-A6]
MTSTEQALALADSWLNPAGSDAPRREVKMHEFDLGWVVWAAPAPLERDPESGERRPPSELGDACGVVDRGTCELTVWPSVPVDEVVRMYRQKHGEASADEARPCAGPGNTAVFTYTAPDGSDETMLFRKSAPGLPPAEHQAAAELRRLGVPAESVTSIHTDLHPSLLPGGYTAELLHSFRNARLSCSQSYGSRPEARAEGIAALVDQVEQTHRMAGRQPPPRPHRLPVPTQVTPAVPLSDEALGEHLVAVFGHDGVRRYAPEAVAASRLPDVTKATLAEAGLPADLPLFFTADNPEVPSAGGLFTDVPTNLRERRSPAGEEKLAVLGHLFRIGFDGVAVIAVQVLPGSTEPNGLGAIWAIDPVTADARYVSISLSAYVRSLALLAETRQRMVGMNPYEAGAAVAELQQQLAAIDATAQANAETWWSLIVEQMWHGLF